MNRAGGKPRRGAAAASRQDSATDPAAVRGPSIDRLLEQRLIVCLGNGGVGKTTVAAALALAAARAGRRTAVITVDPVGRLKDALGLDQLSNEPRPVPLRKRGAHLDALALDTKRTFDDLIERVSPTPQIAAQILGNRLYQELSNELGGSTEYMAMEQLYRLMHREAYELVVVDTPPSSHARDLLSAPMRMTALLASSAVRILKTPSSLLWDTESRLGRMTISTLLRALERWSGLRLLKDLSDFVAAFEYLVDGFRHRAGEVHQALRRPDTSFVLVTTPEVDTVAATIDLDRELRGDGFPIAGVIANRVHSFPPLDREPERPYPERLLRKLAQNYEDFAALTVRDEITLGHLRRETESPLLARLPVLEEAPSSLRALTRFAALLANESPNRR